MPCKTFLQALDFGAMSQNLVDPDVIPDIKSSLQPGRSGRPTTSPNDDGSISAVLKLILGTILPFLLKMIFISGILYLIFFMGLALLIGIINGVVAIKEMCQSMFDGWKENRLSRGDSSIQRDIELNDRHIESDGVSQ